MAGTEAGNFYSNEADRLEAVGGDVDLINALVAVWREAAKRFPLTRACGETAYKRLINGTVRDIEATAQRSNYDESAVNGHIRAVIEYVSHESFEEIAV